MKKILIFLILFHSAIIADDNCHYAIEKIKNIKESIVMLEERKEGSDNRWSKQFYVWLIKKYNNAIEIIKEEEECEDKYE